MSKTYSITPYEEHHRHLWCLELINRGEVVQFFDGFTSEAAAVRKAEEWMESDDRQPQPTDKEVEAAMWEFQRVLDEWREMTDEPAGNTFVWLKVTDKAMRAALIAARKAGTR